MNGRWAPLKLKDSGSWRHTRSFFLTHTHTLTHSLSSSSHVHTGWWVQVLALEGVLLVPNRRPRGRQGCIFISYRILWHFCILCCCVLAWIGRNSRINLIPPLTLLIPWSSGSCLAMNHSHLPSFDPWLAEWKEQKLQSNISSDETEKRT